MATDPATGRRVRLYQLARDLKMTTLELLDILSGLGHAYSSPQNTISSEEARRLGPAIEAAREAAPRATTGVRGNLFLAAIQRYDALTEKGAVSHSTTGDALLDYFAKAGTFRGREPAHVAADVGRMWADSPLLTLRILFYLRLVTRRKRGFFDTEEVQKGQGNRDEFRKAIAWIATHRREALAPNLWLLPVVGSWRDLFHDDLIEALDRPALLDLVARGIGDPYNRDLIAKYLPKVRSKANTFTERHARRNAFVRDLRRHLGWTEKQYRIFKRTGGAHAFQRQMCAGLWNEIDFARVPGRALSQMASHRGKDGRTALERHGQEARYIAWLDRRPTAPFTGHVHELLRPVSAGMSLAQRMTVDKQFDGLLALAREDRGGLTGNVWCALDTSGSMASRVADTTAYDLCVGLGVYFSSLNEGAFRDHVVLFDNESRVLALRGTFSDKVLQIRSASTAWGTTNFQSVIDEIVRVRQEGPDIPVEDFPRTLLVVSDMQLDAPARHRKTNYEAAMARLAAVGLPGIRIVWWWVTGRGKDFPNRLDDEGVTMIGGFDGSVLTLLLGGEPMVVDAASGKRRAPNPYEQMLTALDQEVLRQVRLEPPA